MIRIGVTGHRVLSELEKIDAGVETALSKIEQVFPADPLTCISSLAEGADRIVAHHVLARTRAGLLVVLPLPELDYINDFVSGESRAEFLTLLRRADRRIEMAPTPTRDEAYEAAGKYVVNNSDVLITIWDGQKAHGMGGTGNIVALARQRGMPLAWVHAGNCDPVTHLSTSLGERQGQVSFENF